MEGWRGGEGWDDFRLRSACWIGDIAQMLRIV